MIFKAITSRQAERNVEMKNKIFDLNHERLFIGSLPCGKTQNIVARLGRQLYYIDVDKNGASALVELYKKIGTDRTKQSKYEPRSNIHRVFVKPDVMLDREFFENIAKIQEAQRICSEYGRVLRNY